MIWYFFPRYSRQYWCYFHISYLFLTNSNFYFTYSRLNNNVHILRTIMGSGEDCLSMHWWTDNNGRFNLPTNWLKSMAHGLIFLINGQIFQDCAKDEMYNRLTGPACVLKLRLQSLQSIIFFNILYLLTYYLGRGGEVWLKRWGDWDGLSG